MPDDNPNSPTPDFSGMTSENDTPPDLGIASGDMKGLSDLVNSMASARAPARAPQPQAPQVPRPGLPNIVQFIGGLINPSSPRFNPAGSATGSRAPVFENFIANTLYALGQGLAGEGRGPGAAMRGAGIAAMAPYQRDVQNFQLQNQANQQAAQTQQTQAQTGLVGAQTQEAQINTQMLQRRLGMMDSANPEDAIKGLGPLSPDEQAQVSAGRTQSNMKGDFGPLLQVVEKISNQRAISGRAGPSGVVEDADSKTGFSKVVYDKTGKNIVQVQKDYVAPGLIGKSTSSQRLVQDANGNWNVVNLTSTSTPNVPKKGAGKVPIGGGGTPAGGGPAPGALPGSLKAPGGGGGAPKVTPLGLAGPKSIDAGYAFDPQSNQTVLTTRGEFQGKGLSNFRPVTAAKIEEDRQLNNRLADVQQKIGNYEQAMNQPISTGDTYALSKLMSDQRFDLSVKPFGLGFTVPTGFLTEIERMRQANGLSKEAANRMIAYANAREAMVGYQRVLSGSGRSNEKSLQLQLDVLPSPIMGQDYAANAFGQFKQNLQIAGQGLPKLPGISSAQDIENQQRPQNKGKWNAKTGRYE